MINQFIDFLVQSMYRARTVLFNYPAECISIIIINIIVLLYQDNLAEIYEYLWKLILILVLGIFSFLTVSRLHKVLHRKSTLRFWLTGIIALLLIVYYFYLPNNIDVEVWEYARLMLLILIAILASITLPYMVRRNISGFWNYALHFVKSGLISYISSWLLIWWIFAFFGLLYLLFKIEIDEIHYVKLAVFIMTCLWSIIFLSHLNDYDEATNEYPKLVKFLAQYVFMPLSILYIVPLYIYFTSIVVSSDWINGWVVWYIIRLSVCVLITFYFLYPLKESRSWVSGYMGLMSLALLPILIFYFYAIYLRINDYGMTIPRYIVILYWIFLVVTFVYFLVAKKKSLLLVNFVFLLILWLSLIWPWSVYNLPLHYQTNFLKQKFNQMNVMQNGVLYVPQDLATDQKDIVYADIQELRFTYWVDGLKPFLNHQDIEELERIEDGSVIYQELMKKIWLESYSVGKSSYDDYYDFYWSARGDNEPLFPTYKSDYMLEISAYSSSRWLVEWKNTPLSFSGGAIGVSKNLSGGSIQLNLNWQQISLDLIPIRDALLQKYNTGINSQYILSDIGSLPTAKAGNVEIIFVPKSISGYKSEKSFTSVTWILLIRVL